MAATATVRRQLPWALPDHALDACNLQGVDMLAKCTFERLGLTDVVEDVPVP